jgi:predicted GH43/DUF377 family glycosyl hydrolase
MRWTKQGKIFDPTEYKLVNNCREFSQSPQALVMIDRVRVYFSTRVRDSIGKYLSHIAFVDFDKNMKDIIQVSKHTVIELGKLGCFDEHGIFPMNIVRDGNRVLGYTSGWNRKVSVSVDASIGLAISYDEGLTFKKYGNGPILTASLYEPFLVGDPCVVLYEGRYHMWYIYGTKWKSLEETNPPDRVYKIAHAISADGINWQRESKPIIQDKLHADECQALPTVFHRNGKYHMYFCFRDIHGFRTQREKAYRIGYAYSSNLTNWIRDDGNAGIDVSEEGWDSVMQCYPHTFELNGKIYMLYNGNEFGRLGFGIAMLEE